MAILFWPFSLVLPNTLYYALLCFIMLSNVSILSVHDEGYYRNASYALNLIFTFLFWTLRRWDYDQINFARGLREQSRSDSLWLLYSVGLQQATILRTPRHEGKFKNCLIPLCVVEIWHELGQCYIISKALWRPPQ